MRKLWFIAWRNVWRNRSRSLVVIIAVTLGTLSGVFVAGLMQGWSDQRVRSCIYTEESHIKVQNPDYLINEDINAIIDQSNRVENSISKIPSVVAWSSRLKIGAVVSTSRANSGIILVGIDTVQDLKVSDIHKYIIKNGGTFFRQPTRIPPIVISDKTAELLRIKNYKLTDIQLDSLKGQIPLTIVEKLGTIVNKRYISQLKFEETLKQLIGKTDYDHYSNLLLNKSVYYLLNSKIVASFSLADGQLTYSAFQVVGIYRTTNTMFDQMNGFVLKPDLANCAGLSQNQAHEIAIIVNEHESKLSNVEQQLKATFPDLSVLNWKKLSPDAGLVVDFMDVYNLGIMIVIYLALAFGIINTMLMAVMERMKELGMLMAIGMKRRWVFFMIMMETVFLTMIGAIVGMILGYFLILHTGKTGLNFSTVAEGYEAIGWSSIVYPVISIGFLLEIVVLVIIVAILSSVVPARKVLKLPIIEILKTE